MYMEQEHIRKGNNLHEALTYVAQNTHIIASKNKGFEIADFTILFMIN
jgi:hypothetical protein